MAFRIWLFLLVALVASPGWAEPTVSSGDPDGGPFYTITMTFGVGDPTGLIDFGNRTPLACASGTAYLVSGDGSLTLQGSATRSGAVDAASLALAVLTPSVREIEFGNGSNYFRYDIIAAGTGSSVVRVRCSNSQARRQSGSADGNPIVFAHLYSDVDQLFVADTPKAVVLNNHEVFQGLTHTPGGSKVFVDAAGTLMINAQPQIDRITGGPVQSFKMHLRQNDVIVPNSGIEVDISSTETTVSSLVIPLTFAAGDHFEVWVEVSDADVELNSFPGTPVIPSIIVSVGSISTGGTGGGGENVLDDLIITADCGTPTVNEVLITEFSGLHRILPDSGCIENDTVIIPDLSTFVASAALNICVINDSTVQLLVDASANLTEVVNKSTSNVIPIGATFCVIQTAASSVHLIGTGTGIESLQFIQTIPEVSLEHIVPTLTLTSPSAITFGFSVSEAPLSFSALPVSEPDNMIGMFYNKTSASGTVVNKFEHAWHGAPRVELSFRGTTETANLTFVEFNTDFNPPDNETVVGSIVGFAPLVGEYIAFGGGGTGRVLAWDVGTSLLEWRQDSGTTTFSETITEFTRSNTIPSPGSFDPADGAILAFTSSGVPVGFGVVESFVAGELVWRRRSDLEPAGSDTVADTFGNGATATLGVTITNDDTQTAAVHASTITYLGESQSQWRPYISLWNVLDNVATYSWQTDPANAASAFRLRGPAVGVNWPGPMSPGLNVEGRIISRHVTAGLDGGSAFFTPRTIDVRQDFTGENFAFVSSAAIYIGTPLGPLGSGSTSTSPRGLEIADLKAFTTNTSAPSLLINTQTCNGVPCTNGQFGNLEMVGGEFNTGHPVLGGQGGSGTHIYTDKTDNVLRVRQNFDPGLRTDGEAVTTMTGRNSEGPPTWSISEAAFSNGNEVCTYQGGGVETGRGGTCVGVIEFGNATTELLAISLCTDEVTTGDTFLAMCK